MCLRPKYKKVQSFLLCACVHINIYYEIYILWFMDLIMILGAVKQCVSRLKEVPIGWSSLVTLNKRASWL